MRRAYLGVPQDGPAIMITMNRVFKNAYFWQIFNYVCERMKVRSSVQASDLVCLMTKDDGLGQPWPDWVKPQFAANDPRYETPSLDDG